MTTSSSSKNLIMQNMAQNITQDKVGDILQLLEGFQPITLEEMDAIRLMNRIDTKFVTTQSVLMSILASAREQGYRVFEVEGNHINAYNSLYYDTPQLTMFAHHHNRKLTRQKVRTRVYVDSGLTFLEIKRKNNHRRTKKKRIAIDANLFGDFTSSPKASLFLAEQSDYVARQLTPECETAFQRITLVNADMTERLTIDLNLTFRNHRTHLDASLGNAVIIELKQDGHQFSPMRGILQAHRVKPMRISKYCIAVTLTHPSARSNRFKRKVRQIEKITGAILSVTTK